MQSGRQSDAAIRKLCSAKRGRTEKTETLCLRGTLFIFQVHISHGIKLNKNHPLPFLFFGGSCFPGHLTFVFVFLLKDTRFLNILTTWRLIIQSQKYFLCNKKNNPSACSVIIQTVEWTSDLPIDSTPSNKQSC